MNATTVNLLLAISTAGFVISATTLGLGLYAAHRAKQINEKTKQKIASAKNELKKFMLALEDL